jgi:putative multiple sugar transport system permease protein
MIKGVVLLVAVALDVWQKNQGRASITGMFARGKAARDITPTEIELLEDSVSTKPDLR